MWGGQTRVSRETLRDAAFRSSVMRARLQLIELGSSTAIADPARYRDWRIRPSRVTTSGSLGGAL